MKTSAKISLVIIYFLIMAKAALAQPSDVLWTRSYGGEGLEYCHTIISTLDGGFAVTGTTESNTAGFTDMWLVKVDENGDESWTGLYGGSYYELGSSVVQTSDGGYALVGCVSDNGPIYEYYDMWLVKIDSEGNELWSQSYGGAGWDYGVDLQETADGYILTGHTDSFGGGIGSNIWLLKTDHEGDEIWSQTYNYEIDDEPSRVIKTSDGGFLILGIVWVRNRPYYNTNLCVIKTDSFGNELWVYHSGSNVYSDSGSQVLETVDGNYMIIGSTGTYATDSSDIWLIKIDQNGDEIWSRTYNETGSERGYGIQEANNGYFIVGTKDLFGDDESIWVIRTDAEGVMIWSDYIYNVLPMSLSRIYTAEPTQEGSFVLGANDSPINGDTWLSRLTPTYLGMENGSFDDKDYQFAVDIYPNPFNPSTTVSINLPAPSGLRVSIFNTVGQEVATLADGDYPVGNHDFTFDGTGLTSGIYFVQATDSGGLHEVRKIVLLK
ncbi:T9SS type A sorting domain-containing protein [bacterium]|nr:T9SS type A sorting domain-containing protein [bacterium]